MVLAFLLWLGELVGLVAAVLPGGTDPETGALWGAGGAIGLIVLLLVIFAGRRIGRTTR